MFKPYRTAIFSREVDVFGDPQYRYELMRKWAAKGHIMVFIMLNPSTADAHKDDPTIRKCIYYAKREGCAGIRVVNLFAYRARDPKSLSEVDDPVGPRNDYFISEAIRRAKASHAPIVLAWGDSIVRAGMTRHSGHITDYVGDYALCFGITKKGQPKHPLYLKNDALLFPYHALERV